MFYLVEFFDKENNGVSDHHFLILIRILFPLQTGALTSQLSNNPFKVNGLAGITLGTIIQSISCLITGSILGLAFVWKVALVAIGTLATKFSSLILTQAHNLYQHVFHYWSHRVTFGW